MRSSTTGTELYYKGCVDFTAATTSPADTSECAGMTLVATTAAPYIGSGGDFSISWMLDHIVTAQETLN